MKKITLSIIMLLSVISAFSQQITPIPSLTKQDYFLKSKHQKTAAWVLLGSGLALSTIGTITAAPKVAKDVGSAIIIIPGIFAGVPPPEPAKNDYTIETILIVGGTTAMLSSIPLFIASGKNKRKAMSLSFKNEMAPQINKGSLVYSSVPSLTLKFKL